MTRTIVEKPSTLEVREVGRNSVLVVRKAPGQRDDWLGRITRWANGKYMAEVESRGPTGWSTDFASEDEAVRWLAGLQPDERNMARHRYERERKLEARREWDRERRERPQWYDSDGHHIGR